jgi:hypothetical protein
MNRLARCEQEGCDASKSGAPRDANPYAPPPPFPSDPEGTFRQRLAQAWEMGWLRCVDLARQLSSNL